MQSIQKTMANPRYIRYIFNIKCHAMDTILNHSKRSHGILFSIKHMGRLDIYDLYDHLHSAHFPWFLDPGQMGKSLI